MNDAPKRGRGRPAGVPNKVPSKARLAQEALLEKLGPHLDLFVEQTVELLTNPNTKPQDKVALLRLWTDFIAKAGAQDTVDGAVEALCSATVSDLLRLKKQAAGGASEAGE